MRQLSPETIVQVATLPAATGALKGALVYLTTDDLLYLCDGAAWVAQGQGTDTKVAVVEAGVPGYLWGTNGTDGVLRTNTGLQMTKDAGDGFVTLEVPASTYEAFGAVSTHESALDPHTQYLTESAAVLAYESIGAAASAISAHEGAADPHPGYLTAAEAALAYADIAHIHATSNLLKVTKTAPTPPGEYSTLAAAIAACTSPSTTNRYVIQVGPGEYTEVNSSVMLDIPNYVYVTGNDPWNSAVLKCSDLTKDFIRVRPNGGMFNIAVSGPTTAGKSAVVQNESGIIKLYWVNIKEGSYGVTLAPASGTARCHCIGVVTDGPTVMNRMFNCEYNLTTSPGTGVFILMQSGPMSTTWTGANAAAVYLSGDGTSSSPKANATLDLCQFRGSGSSGQVYSDVYVDNGALCRGISCSMAGGSLTDTKYAINVGPNNGTGYKSKVDIHSTQIKPGGYTKDIKIQNSVSSVSFSGTCTEAGLDFVANAIFNAVFADASFGQVIYGDLYVGNATVKTPVNTFIQTNKDTGLDSGGGLSRGAGKQSVIFSVTKAGADSTGLANDATAYTAGITVDGVLKNISVVGSAAQTFTTLLAEINTDLAGAGTASLVSGNIQVASATNGVLSTVSIADTNLFSTLTNYSSIQAAHQRTVNVALGKAFVDTASGLKLVTWTATSVEIPASTAEARIYINSSGVANYSTSAVDKTLNVQLGECSSDANSITALFDQSVILPQFRPRLYSYLEHVVGPINHEGGTVTANATAFKLDATSSTYHLTEEAVVTSAGTAIKWFYWYRDGSGGWTVLDQQDTIDNTLRDDGDGTRVAMTASYYKGELLFVSKNAGGTDFHVVCGQDEFATANEVQINPITPAILASHACRLARIVVQQGAAAITSITDQRPKLGQMASATTSVTIHNDLTGRDSATAHTQYQLTTAKGAADGYASLDGTTKVPLAQLPTVTDYTHGDKAGGTLHSVATGSVAGFMSATDKSKLDGIASGEVNTASNLGTGSGWYASKSGVDLRFKSIIGSAEIALTANANDITLSARRVTSTITAATGTTTMPATAPDSTDGTQVWTGSITPSSASNRVRIQLSTSINGGASGSNTGATWALFRSTTLIATGHTFGHHHGASQYSGAAPTIDVEDAPASTSSVTYNLRVGANAAGSWYFGRTSATPFAAQAAQRVTLTEVAAV